MARVKGLTIRGSKEFQKRLTALRKAHPTRFGRGLIRAGLYVHRESQKIVPVDTGALKGSSYTRHTGTGADMVVRIGYQQSYAVFVHERTELRHKPGKSAKYLEIPLRKGVKDMVKIINREFDVHGKI